jgi:integrative and conjugative element protein (TIGR02256 family)
VITYPIGASGQLLRLSDNVIAHFERHRQTKFWQREAGGLLFAKFDLPLIAIEEATGPRRTDRRTRYSYAPDVDAERKEIEQRFRDDLHFVGCWHTHPEDLPTPSPLDIRNTSDCVRRSKHALNGFVMAIIGRTALPAGLFLSICDRAAVHGLGSGSQARNATAADVARHRAVIYASIISLPRTTDLRAFVSAGRRSRASATSTTHTNFSGRFQESSQAVTTAKGDR